MATGWCERVVVSRNEVWVSAKWAAAAEERNRGAGEREIAGERKPPFAAVARVATGGRGAT